MKRQKERERQTNHTRILNCLSLYSLLSPSYFIFMRIESILLPVGFECMCTTVSVSVDCIEWVSEWVSDWERERGESESESERGRRDYGRITNYHDPIWRYLVLSFQVNFNLVAVTTNDSLMIIFLFPLMVHSKYGM